MDIVQSASRVGWLIELQKSKVTAAGVADFAKTLPRCRTEWDGGIVEPKPK